VVLAFRQDYETRAEDIAIGALAVLFLCEFAARCYDALDRRAYLRDHWLDLVTAIPVPGIPGLRILRLLRMLRFVRLGVLLRRHLLARGWNDFSMIWPTLALFWLGSALALWLVEHDAPHATITTFPQAMTVAFLTASTLGFGAHSDPITVDGQIISGLIVFVALGLWGFASSQLTQMWLQAGKTDHHEPELAGLRSEIEALRREVAILISHFSSSESPRGYSPGISFDIHRTAQRSDARSGAAGVEPERKRSD
jgi:voltage-gated potassium channel